MTLHVTFGRSTGVMVMPDMQLAVKNSAVHCCRLAREFCDVAGHDVTDHLVQVQSYFNNIM